jgi:hypothetical protein
MMKQRFRLASDRLALSGGTQEITVSLKTVKIVNALPDLGLPKEKIAEMPDVIQ